MKYYSLAFSQTGAEDFTVGSVCDKVIAPCTSIVHRMHSNIKSCEIVLISLADKYDNMYTNFGTCFRYLSNAGSIILHTGNSLLLAGSHN